MSASLASLALPTTLIAAHAAPLQEQGSAPAAAVTLELEALDGSRRQIRPGEPALSDPRQESAWIVRVLGLEASPQTPRTEATAEGLPVAEVTLVGGDLLRGAIVDGGGETLSLRIAGGATLPLAIDAMQGLVVPEQLPASLSTPLEAPEEGDRIYARTGTTLDRDDGALIGFDAEGVRFESSVLGERSVAWDDLAALFIEVFGDAPQAADDEGVPVAVDLGDGGRLRGRMLRLDEEGLALRVAGTTEIELPLTQVALVTVMDGRLLHLSELTPAGEVGRGAPFGDELGLVFEHAADRAATGGPLHVSGRRYARGLGMHAPSRLLFDVPEGWTELRGSVGIDDSTARLPADARGSAVFRVRWNGEVLWESPVVRGGAGVVPMPPLELAGAGDRRLELEVDAVEDFRGDRANWLEPILLR